jgi:signal transduction histidine kinase
VKVDGTQADAVVVTVANSGTIPAELLPQLFDPFRGAQRQTGRAEGLGLGLYIVQQIVVAHGGNVQVQSGENNRTTFTVTIPR